MPIVEPVITWNLFVTPVVVGIAIWISTTVLNRLMVKRDKQKEVLDAKIKELMEEKELLLQQHEHEKDVALLAWRTEFSQKQCSIEIKVDAIVAALYKKVDWSHCNERRDALEKILGEMRESFKGRK